MEKILAAQKEYFASAEPMKVRFRAEALDRLRLALRHHESDLFLALHVDLGISEKAAAQEGLPRVYRTLEAAISRLKKRIPMEKIRRGGWSFPGLHERTMPWGALLCCAGGGWPEEAALLPAIAALEAGNCLTLCPCENCRQTAQVLGAVFEESFENRYACLLPGGREALEAAASLPYDRIWFSGSEEEGKRVYQAAAKNAVPVFSQIQGKNWVIVAHDADVEEAAKKIARAKFPMSGQTPYAPSCCLTAENLQNALLEALRDQIEQIDRETLPKMASAQMLTQISQRAVRHRLICGGSISHAGRWMEPTVLSGMRPQEAMEWAALPGPALAVAAFRTTEEAVQALRGNRGDMLCYFSQDPGAARHVLMELPYQTLIWNGCRLPENVLEKRRKEATEKSALILRG